MSSSEENARPTLKKRRRLQRACDYCKSKKIKCDRLNMPNNYCSQCAARGIECSYLMGQVQSNPYPSLSYVEDLEGRLERMEKLMNRFLPNNDMAKELAGHQSDNALTPTSERSHASGSRVGSPLNPSGLTAVPPPTPASPDNALGDDHNHSDSEGGQEPAEELSEGMRKLSVSPTPLRYHGKSSGLAFIRSAMALKNAYVGAQPPPRRDERHPWLKVFVEDEFPLIGESNFPPCDLMDELVDLYFTQSIMNGEHLVNGGFGATVLLVCAVASRSSRDPRVLLDGSDHHHSAGWKWFLLVERVRKMSFAPAKIFDLQICALMALFLQASNSPQSTWSVTGAGIRIALDVGAHRKTMYSSTPNMEDELWRRAFWILVLFEWTASYGIGRPSSIHDEDFDLALPTECDDEYWFTPEGEPSFEQPPDKPSTVTAFVYALKLGQILAFAMRTVYLTNKSRAQRGQSDEQWDQHIVADLDSALNNWSDSLPSYLRWDQEQEDELWLTQAATLNAFHSYIQVAVHRPFMAASRRESPLSFPSVIICTNGARSAIQVLEVLSNRTGIPGHRNMGILFMSGIVLMMNVLGLKRAGRAVHCGKDLALVEKAIGLLWSLRYEMHAAESLGGMLQELVTAIRQPLPPRTRMPDVPQEHGASTTDANDSHTRTVFSSASVVSAHQDTVLHISSGPDFLQSDALHFAHPPGSNDYGVPAQGFAAPTAGPSTQRDPLDRIHPLSTHPHAYSFLQRQELIPAQPQHHSHPEQNQFDMTGQQFFGLQPLGYSEPTSFVPSASTSSSTSPFETTTEYGHLHSNPTNATVIETGHYIDIGVPDFATLMGGASMAAWSNLPPAMRWEEWSGYFPNTNNPGT